MEKYQEFKKKLINEEYMPPNTLIQRKLTKGVGGWFMFVKKGNKVYPTHVDKNYELITQSTPIPYPFNFGMSVEEYFEISYDQKNKSLHNPLKGKIVKFNPPKVAKNYKPTKLRGSLS